MGAYLSVMLSVISLLVAGGLAIWNVVRIGKLDDILDKNKLTDAKSDAKKAKYYNLGISIGGILMALLIFFLKYQFTGPRGIFLAVFLSILALGGAGVASYLATDKLGDVDDELKKKDNDDYEKSYSIKKTNELISAIVFGVAITSIVLVVLLA